MDPDGKWTSTRAVLLTAAGQNRWPPAGSYMAATGQDLMAADTPRLRAHRGEPLSRDHPQIPVSMPSLFRFDASAVAHTRSSSHRTPAPLTARRHPQRSPPRLLTDAACGSLESPPARQPRRTNLHHWHSTDRADDLLHHHHFPSGHTWVPIIRSWAMTRGFALRSGTRNRYEIRYTRTGSARIAAGQRPRPSFRHPHAMCACHCTLAIVSKWERSRSSIAVHACGPRTDVCKSYGDKDNMANI